MCTGAQQGLLARTRFFARGRVTRAYDRVNGTYPEREEMPGFGVKSIVTRILHVENPDLEFVAGILGKMQVILAKPSLHIQCVSERNAFCESRAAFVVKGQEAVYLCPSFFSRDEENRIRTLIHETAHLSGIGDVAQEEYFRFFDGQESGGVNAADSWSHLVHVLSGQPLDKIEEIEGK